MMGRTLTGTEADACAQSRAPSGDDSLGGQLRDYALAEITRATTQLAREGDSRHAGVHQARKSLRRVRATLALARRPLGEQGRRLDQALGSLCRGLGGLRDAQALTEALQRLEPTAMQGLLPQALDLATARRELVLARSLQRDPDFSRRRARLEAFAARLARMDWDALRSQDVLSSVARSERRLAKARRRATRRPKDDERWHVFRRRLRRLRQQDGVLLGLAPTLRPKGSVAPAEATALGHSQDDVLLLRHCGRGSPFTPAMRRVIRDLASQRLAQTRAAAQ